MPNQYMRLLDRQEIVSDEAGEYVDLGPYRGFAVQIRVVRGGDANDEINIQHAASTEEGAWKTLTGGTFSLESEDNFVEYFDEFLRYVRWKAGTIGGTPLVIVDLVAKET